MHKPVIINRLTFQEALVFAREILNIYKQSWLVTYPDKNIGLTVRDIEDWFSNFDKKVRTWKKDILSKKDRAVWTITNESGKIIGFCIVRTGKKFNELEYIYILPDYVGQGLGSKMMKTALDYLSDKKPVVLYGAAHNFNAINFYKKFGFVKVKTKVGPKKLANGKEIPSMKMMKKSI